MGVRGGSGFGIRELLRTAQSPVPRCAPSFALQTDLRRHNHAVALAHVALPSISMPFCRVVVSIPATLTVPRHKHALLPP